MHELKLSNGDRYTFVGVDACIDPGPKRPFNFFGKLTDVCTNFKYKYNFLKNFKKYLCACFFIHVLEF